MSLAWKPDSTRPLLRETPPPASGPVDRTVGVGDLIALPILVGLDGRPVDLIEIAAGRSVVVVFDHGAACPYSRAALRAYAAALPQIEAAGGVLIVVASDRSGPARETLLSNDAPFLVVVDDGHRFAQSLGLAAVQPTTLRPPERARSMTVTRRTVVPASYVLAPCGRVTWAHADPDAIRPPDPYDVVAALQRLAAIPSDHGQAADIASWESIR